MLRVNILLNHPLRILVSQYLRENNFVIGTILTDEEIQVIQDGGTI